MTRQQKAKQLQGYNPKPEFPMCSNCLHFELDIEEIPSFGSIYHKEVNLRCGHTGQDMGMFAVKKQGTCAFHEFKHHKR